MNSTLDLRVQKTQAALIKALLALLQEKTFEKLTVNELCEKAQIRRPTFYKHFNDKYDFLKFTIYYLQREQMNQIVEETEASSPVDFFMGLFRRMIELVDEHQKIFLSLELDTSLLLLLESAGDKVEKDMVQRLERFVREGNSLPTDPAFAMQAVSGILKQTGIYWLRNQETISKAEVVAKVRCVLDWFFHEVPLQEGS